MKKMIPLTALLLLITQGVQAKRTGLWSENALVFTSFGTAITLRAQGNDYFFGRDNPNLGGVRLPGGDQQSRDYEIPADPHRSSENMFGVGFQFDPTQSEVTPGSGVYFIRGKNGGSLKIKLEAKATLASDDYAPLTRGRIINGPIWYGKKPSEGGSNLTTGVDVRATLLVDEGSYQTTASPDTPIILSFDEMDLGRIKMVVNQSSGVNKACCGKPAVFVLDTEGQRIKLTGTVVTFRPQSCTVSAGDSNQTVSLKTIKKRDIPKLNSTTDAATFKISLDCNKSNNFKTGGRQFNPINKVAITFNAFNPDSSQRNNGTNPILPIEKGAGKAEGVGLKILYNDVPVNFGQDSANKNNPGAVNLGQIRNTTPSYVFKTQYVNTNGAVKGGEVRAKVGFTLSYQ